MLHTETDLFSNRWLFKYLTQILDERMLDMLMLTPMRYFDIPLSLNFNIETILSKKFIDFDTNMKLIIKVPVVVEVQIGDAFCDIAGFTAARNILERLGYKLCLDGVTGFSMMQIDREKLGVDLIKLQWNADLEGDANKVENRPLKRAIENAGSGRVILCRCDTRQAVSYGQAMGVNLFQGRYIDRIINPHQKVEN
jgi:EAL domain-containing protein (putative c-di-GMP-specific phosphodiesterase class I)